MHTIEKGEKMRFMNNVFFVILLAVSSLWSDDIKLAEPHPTAEKPREVIMGIGRGDAESIRHLLESAGTIMNYYGPEKVRLRIVAYGEGIRLVNKNEKETAEKVRALMQEGVAFTACGETMDRRKMHDSLLIEEVEVVSVGIVDVVERIQGGSVYLQP